MATKQDYGRLLNLAQCAERSGLALWTWRKWASQRRIPIVKLGGRVFVTELDLAKLIDAHRREPRPGVAV